VGEFVLLRLGVYEKAGNYLGAVTGINLALDSLKAGIYHDSRQYYEAFQQAAANRAWNKSSITFEITLDILKNYCQ